MGGALTVHRVASGVYSLPRKAPATSTGGVVFRCIGFVGPGGLKLHRHRDTVVDTVNRHEANCFAPVVANDTHVRSAPAPL